MAAALFFILFPAYMKGNSVTVMVTITVAGLLYIGVLVAVRLRKRSTSGTSQSSLVRCALDGPINSSS